MRNQIPSWELTYPTWGKGKSSLKVPSGGYVSSQEGISFRLIFSLSAKFRGGSSFGLDALYSETMSPYSPNNQKKTNQFTKKNSWLVVSTHLKNISQIGNLLQVGVKIKIFETTNQMNMFPTFGVSKKFPRMDVAIFRKKKHVTHLEN